MNSDAVIEFSKRAPLRRQLEASDWWAIVRHGLSGLWAIAFFFYTSASYQAVATQLMAGITVGLVVIGSAVATFGRFSFRNKSFEFSGLTFSVVGWLLYSSFIWLQLVAVDHDWTRLAVLILCYLSLTIALERWIQLLVAVLQDAGWIKSGVRIRRRTKAKQKK